MGGLEAGPVAPVERDYLPWEKKVDALVRLAGDPKRKMVTVDELRRAVEDIGPGAYDELTYYERWISALTNVLVAKGYITVDELGRRIEEVRARWQEARR
jgi:hypothetical protein